MGVLAADLVVATGIDDGFRTLGNIATVFQKVLSNGLSADMTYVVTAEDQSIEGTVLGNSHSTGVVVVLVGYAQKDRIFPGEDGIKGVGL